MADSQPLVLPLQVVDEHNVALELDAAVRRLLCECFPSDGAAFSVRRAWNDVRPSFSVFSRHGDKVVGQVGIVERRISCGGVAVRVAGVQSLAVAPDWRRSRLSQRLMVAAMQEAQRRGVRFGLLFCVPELEGFTPVWVGGGSSKPSRCATRLADGFR